MKDLRKRARLWLADQLYRLSCRLAARDDVDASLRAGRMEEIARNWREKYRVLRRVGKIAGPRRWYEV